MDENKITERTKKIVALPGDGIGPEIVAEAIKVLEAAKVRFGLDIQVETLPVGGSAYDLCGKCLPHETLEKCKAADAVLLGAVGGPKWDSLPGAERPERALLGLRSGLGLFCNLRPARIWPSLAEASPIKCAASMDMVVVRELTGGVYFGAHTRSEDGLSAQDVMAYSAEEIERIARKAFECARQRRGKVTSVDKANVLETSRLWREVVNRISAEYPGIELEHMYVDNAAMQLVRDPGRFDVLLTENMFGDILSDEASQLTGSIGLLPSASLRTDSFGMYEPIHGSAPDIALKGIANPLATILSVAMMLRYSLGMPNVADAVERAVSETIDAGLRTPDISGGGASVSTSEMGSAVAAHVHA